jgi:anti-anti-sigma factor
MNTISDNVSSKLDAGKRRLLVEIREDITSTHIAELRDSFHHLIESSELDKWTHLYLDLRSCRVVDSMGINWIFAESLRLKKMEKVFVIRISSPAIFRVMEFAGLDRLVTIKYRRRKQTR